MKMRDDAGMLSCVSEEGLRREVLRELFEIERIICESRAIFSQ